jgi:HlyD family secretion protein
MKLEPSHSVKSSQFVQNLKKKGKITWLPWLLVLCLLGGVGYIVYRQVVIVSRQEANRKVLSAPVVRQSLPVTVSANGTVKPERSINLSPKTAGVLKRLLVKEGDTVKEGQIIAYMDDSNLQGQLTQARGELAQAEANLQKLITGNRPQDIAQAEARLKNAQALFNKTEDDFRRNQNLYNAGAISLLTLNQKRADRDSAQAQVAEAQQALKLQKAGTRREDLDQARAQVISAKGSLQTIQAQINDTIIRAPFAGVVTKKYADPGAFVTPTTAGSEVSSATSSSILSLASTNQVVANVAESNIAQLRLGQKATIKADAYPRQVFEGKVIQIAAQATVEENVTSFEVKVAILSDSQKLLRAGMNVEVAFQAGQLENALLIPTAAVVRQPQGTGVWVVRASDPVFTPIETGITVNDKTEVRSGLTGDERVLLSFPPGFRPQSQPRFPGFPGGRPTPSSSPAR